MRRARTEKRSTGEGAVDIGFVASVLGAVEPVGAPGTPPSVRERGSARPGAVGEAEATSSAFGPGVAVSLSAEAQSLVGPGAPAKSSSGDGSRADAEARKELAAEAGPRGGSGRPGELTDDEQEEVTRLEQRDAEVRAHENAHKAAAGQHARGGPTYEFERGPDGRRYAVGGEVQIDTSPVPNDPDATILKMRQVRRAALAPAEPSPQDRRVASEASQQESAARREKLAQQQAEGGARKSDAYSRASERPLGGVLDLTA